MKSKTFVILLVICAVLGAVAYFTVGQKAVQDNQGKMGEKLLPDFPVNEVVKIAIQTPEGTVTLNKGETLWEVEDKFNYPADFSKLADIVKQLRDTKIGRQFNADEEKISRLGLNPPDQADLPEEQKGARITLSDKENKPLADIILGKSREGGGHYVMLAGASEICMVDQNFQFIDKKPDEWLDKELTKVPSEDVEKIVCLDPKTDAPVYTLRRPEKGKEPEFVDPPEGKKIKKAKISTLFGALASFRIDSVADPATEPEGAMPEGPVFAYHLFDGTVYKVYPGNALEDDKDKYTFKVGVSFSAPEKKAPEETPETAAEDTEKEEKSEPEEAGKSESELAAEATALNEKFSPWTYIISKWRHDNFVADPDEFFEEVKAEEVKSHSHEEAEPESEESETPDEPDAELEEESPEALETPQADGTPEPDTTEAPAQDEAEAETPEPEKTEAAVQGETPPSDTGETPQEAETPEPEKTDAAVQGETSPSDTGETLQEAETPEPEKTDAAVQGETPPSDTGETPQEAETSEPEKTEAAVQGETPPSDTGETPQEAETPESGTTDAPAQEAETPESGTTDAPAQEAETPESAGKPESE